MNQNDWSRKIETFNWINGFQKSLIVFFRDTLYYIVCYLICILVSSVTNCYSAAQGFNTQISHLVSTTHCSTVQHVRERYSTVPQYFRCLCFGEIKHQHATFTTLFDPSQYSCIFISKSFVSQIQRIKMRWRVGNKILYLGSHPREYISKATPLNKKMKNRTQKATLINAFSYFLTKNSFNFSY